MKQQSLSLESKLPRLGTTIFTKMSLLARQEEAINLSQGFPDFECHPELIDRVSHYMKKGANQYAPMAGIPALKEQIAIKSEKAYNCSLDPESEVTVVSGASEAIFNALAVLVRPGDEVIFFEPGYDLYQPVTELMGGIPVPIPLNAEDYSIDWEKTAAKVSDKTRAIIINSPHNPSGSILKAEDLRQLEKLIADKPIFVISDEVYEHIIFDEQAHESVLKYPLLKERSFAVFSFGKTFHATGWKIGYCIAPAELSKEFRKIHQYNTFSTFTPAQMALADFLKNPDNYLSLGAFYQERRDKFQELMRETPFQMKECQGTYFQLASYGHLSEEADTEYSVRLTKEVGVATIPLSPFYSETRDDKTIRFCFAKKYETLEQAVEKMIQHKNLLYQS
ncbi:MAG: methionine aminotransferase [Bacteroidota bacterium]